MGREITDEEWRGAGELDGGRSWNEFPDADLMACDTALSHLDEQFFVYYLPAYLLFALRYIPLGRSSAQSSSRLHTERRTRLVCTRSSHRTSARSSLRFSSSLQNVAPTLLGPMLRRHLPDTG
jgi:hypothetical protein